MMGREAALALLEKAMDYSKAQETDIYLSAQDLGLSRFAGGAIHQNVAHSNIVLNIRSVTGKRLGRATTNDLSDAGVRKTGNSSTIFSLASSYLRLSADVSLKISSEPSSFLSTSCLNIDIAKMED